MNIHDIELPGGSKAKEILSLVDTLIASVNAAHHAKSNEWRDECFRASDETYQKIKTELAATEADRKKFGRNDNDKGNDSDNRKRRGSIVNNASASSEPPIGYVHLVPDEHSDSYDVRFWKPVSIGTKLYAAPQPAESCASPMSDKPACDAQNTKCETQPAAPVVKESLTDTEPVRSLPELSVTKGGIPFEDQNEGIRQFKEACMAAADLEAKRAALSAGPVNDPSDEALLNLLADCGAMTTMNGVKAIRLALTRYGQSTQPAEPVNGEELLAAREALIDMGYLWDGDQWVEVAPPSKTAKQAPEWPDFARMEASLQRLKERLVFENGRRKDLEQRLREKRNG